MNLRRTWMYALGSLLLAACDIPTESPIVEQRWILPLRNTSVSVSELLPTGVTASGANFAVSISPFVSSRALGEVCPACAALNGATLPVPPFGASFTATASLPNNVSSATITSGSAQVAVQNGFSFDPTQGGGSATITVTDGPNGRQLGQVTFASGQLPPGATVTRTLTIAPGTVGSSLVGTTQITSPGGQVTTINSNQRVTVTVTPQSLLVSRATVNVSGRSVSVSSIDIPDVPDIGDEVQEGAIILDLTNPFGVTVNVQLAIRHDGGTITKAFTVGSAATSTVRVAFTRDELQAIFDSDGATLSGTGTVTGGTITVTPGQQVDIRAKLDFTLRLPAS